MKVKQWVNSNRYWLRILGIVIPYAVITGTFQYVGMLIAGVNVAKPQSLTLPWQDFITCFFALAGTILSIWIFRKYVDKQSFVNLGFGKTMMQTDIWLGLLIGFTIMAVSFVLLLLTHQILFVGTKFNLPSILYSFGFYIFVAITEELLVRGYMLNNLLNACNKYVALIISSVIFSALHGLNPNVDAFALFEIALAGFLLGLAYIYTKSLWFPIALHFSWNFFQGTIFGFNVSGNEKYNLITISRKVDNIWNGGLFGYENSITSVFFQVAAIIVIYFLFKNRAAGFTDSKQNT